MLIDPTFEDSEKVVKEGISGRRTLFLVGECSVEYVGRAKSTLEPGDRMLIIKADGSFLVHRPTGYDPVNWMPGGKVNFSVQSKEDSLEVRAVRHKPSESVKASFTTIKLIAALNLLDNGEFSLYASEEDMQKAILLKPELLEDGLKPISWEKKVDPGFIDVYGTDKQGRLVVVEIKRKTAGKDAALQLIKYIGAIKQKADREVRGVLAAPRIAKDVQRLLVTSGLEYKHLDPRKCADALRRVENKRLAEYFTRNHR